MISVYQQARVRSSIGIDMLEIQVGAHSMALMHVLRQAAIFQSYIFLMWLWEARLLSEVISNT